MLDRQEVRELEIQQRESPIVHHPNSSKEHIFLSSGLQFLSVQIKKSIASSLLAMNLQPTRSVPLMYGL